MDFFFFVLPPLVFDICRILNRPETKMFLMPFWLNMKRRRRKAEIIDAICKKIQRSFSRKFNTVQSVQWRTLKSCSYSTCFALIFPWFIAVYSLPLIKKMLGVTTCHKFLILISAKGLKGRNKKNWPTSHAGFLSGTCSAFLHFDDDALWKSLDTILMDETSAS